MDDNMSDAQLTDTDEACCAMCGGTFDRSNLTLREDALICADCDLAAAASQAKKPPSPAELLARRRARRARNIVIFMTLGSILAFGAAAAVFKFKEHSGSFQQQFYDAYAGAQRLAVAGKYEEALKAFQDLEKLYETRPAEFQEITQTLADAREEAQEAYVKAVSSKLKQAEDSLQRSDRNGAVINYRAARDFIIAQTNFRPATEMLERMETIKKAVESNTSRK